MPFNPICKGSNLAGATALWDEAHILPLHSP